MQFAVSIAPCRMGGTVNQSLVLLVVSKPETYWVRSRMP